MILHLYCIQLRPNRYFLFHYWEHSQQSLQSDTISRPAFTASIQTTGYIQFYQMQPRLNHIGRPLTLETSLTTEILPI